MKTNSFLVDMSWQFIDSMNDGNALTDRQATSTLVSGYLTHEFSCCSDSYIGCLYNFSFISVLDVVLCGDYVFSAA